MGFVPNTTITLYKGVPLDNSYENVFYFSSVSQQSSYFNSLSPIVVLNENYRVEPNRESIKLQMPYSKVFNCNYMRFKNTSYENKWFYAFVTAVDYVNEETSMITFEIDVMQTWLPNIDYELEQCFVEREHSISDEIGYNLEPESIDAGQMISNPSDEQEIDLDEGSFSEGYWNYYIVAIAEPSIHKYQRLYSGAKYFAYDSRTEILAMESKIREYSGESEKVLGIWVVPRIAIESVDSVTHELLSTNSIKDVNINGITNETTLDGYHPRNKKLLSYPFNYLEIVSADGSSMDLAYEYFKNDQNMILPPSLRIATTVSSPVEVVIRPYRYRQTESFSGDYTEKLTLKSFPVCTWTNDAYKAYLDNGFKLDTINAITSIPEGAMSGAKYAATGGKGALGLAAVSAASNLIESTKNLGINVWQAKKHNASAQGICSTSNADFASNAYKFIAYRLSCHHKRAKRIDDYFQMYGYASNEIKVPFIHSRQKWTYTKTIGCSLSSAKLPTEDMRKIEEIFDSGVRFWADHASIGNYNQSNPVLSSVN